MDLGKMFSHTRYRISFHSFEGHMKSEKCSGDKVGGKNSWTRENVRTSWLVGSKEKQFNGKG